METACLSILLKKNKLLHLTFAGPNTHTYTRTHAKNITPQPALLWLWQNSNCQQGSSFSHLASEKLRYPKQSLSPCGKAKNRMHLDIRSKQRSIPTLKCSFECTFHKTSLKKTKMPQLICADTRRHTDTHRHAHTNAHCTKHTIHSILRHVAEIKHADASQWYSKTHTQTQTQTYHTHTYHIFRDTFTAPHLGDSFCQQLTKRAQAFAPIHADSSHTQTLTYTHIHTTRNTPQKRLLWLWENNTYPAQHFEHPVVFPMTRAPLSFAFC